MFPRRPSQSSVNFQSCSPPLSTQQASWWSSKVASHLPALHGYPYRPAKWQPVPQHPVGGIRVPSKGVWRTSPPSTSTPTIVAARPYSQLGQGPAKPNSVLTTVSTQLLQESICNPHWGHPWSIWSWWPVKIVLVGPTGHLLYKTILSIPLDIVDLPNT